MGDDFEGGGEKGVGIIDLDELFKCEKFIDVKGDMCVKVGQFDVNKGVGEVFDAFDDGETIAISTEEELGLLAEFSSFNDGVKEALETLDRPVDIESLPNLSDLKLKNGRNVRSAALPIVKNGLWNKIKNFFKRKR